jgi:hypothetical protein
VLGRVAEPKLVLARPPSLTRVGEPLEQRGEPLLPFRVVPGRVELGERRMRQDVDRTISPSSSSDAAPARARPSM